MDGRSPRAQASDAAGPESDARAFIRGTRVLDASEALGLVSALKSSREWALARGVLELVDAAPELDALTRRKVHQEIAICTYKDASLRLLPALEKALEVLASPGDELASTTDAETLGVAGAIHKRMWQITGHRRQLAVALGYYLRGVAGSGGDDLGYNAINAAFLLDSLAEQDAQTARAASLPDGEAEDLRRRASTLRREILARHGEAAAAAARAPAVETWWLVATAAEAALGLGEWARARSLLGVAEHIDGLPDWQIESTMRQLAALSELRPGPDGEALDVVAGFAGRPVTEVAAIVGRVGLALSGGGLRASFFHLGVLARLAELDVLRRIEVLSCVSGGSILGAHYYLELRRRMQTRTDEQMTREAYIDIVRCVARDFYAATTRNLRWHALTNPRAILLTAFKPGYNRTTKVGELLDRDFYGPLLDGDTPVLSRLGIEPLGAPTPFNPHQDNWRRSAKVPLLILNATTLNTGHNWQFTTAWMGEPYTFIDERTDANYRLARVDLADCHSSLGSRLTLGQAAAASASVPGALEPLALTGVYPGKDVRVVDGGVMDNQGVYGLLEEECTVVLVSDASGQMNSDDTPPVWPVPTMRRSNAILMAAVRSTSFRELDALRRSERLKGLLYLHLKRDLRAGLVTQDTDGGPGPDVDAGVTSYGIPRTIQRRLAGLRTDLDVFSEAEAFTLMLSGYRMTTAAFPEELPHFPVSSAPPVDWAFQVVADAVDAGESSPRVERLAQLIGQGARRGRTRPWREPVS